MFLQNGTFFRDSLGSFAAQLDEEIGHQVGIFGIDQLLPTIRGDDFGRVGGDELDAGRLELGGLVQIGQQK